MIFALGTETPDLGQLCLLQDIDIIYISLHEVSKPPYYINLGQDKIMIVSRLLRFVVFGKKVMAGSQRRYSMQDGIRQRGRLWRWGSSRCGIFKNSGNESSKEVVFEEVRGPRARTVNSSRIGLPEEE